jgi:predicted N-acetyltransferase YhbS
MGIVAPRPLVAGDDRSQFDCGQTSLNEWFERHAWRNHLLGDSRINVICDANDKHIVGYVALAAAQVERAKFPKSQQRNRPSDVPMVLLGQLAVDTSHQGQGLAAALVRFAFANALRAAEIIGCAGIVTQPISDEVRVFYHKFGFRDLPFDPKRAMTVRIADIKTSSP